MDTPCCLGIGVDETGLLVVGADPTPTRYQLTDTDVMTTINAVINSLRPKHVTVICDVVDGLRGWVQVNGESQLVSVLHLRDQHTSVSLVTTAQAMVHGLRRLPASVDSLNQLTPFDCTGSFGLVWWNGRRLTLHEVSFLNNSLFARDDLAERVPHSAEWLGGIDARSQGLLAVTCNQIVTAYGLYQLLFHTTVGPHRTGISRGCSLFRYRLRKPYKLGLGLVGDATIGVRGAWHLAASQA